MVVDTVQELSRLERFAEAGMLALTEQARHQIVLDDVAVDPSRRLARLGQADRRLIIPLQPVPRVLNRDLRFNAIVQQVEDDGENETAFETMPVELKKMLVSDLWTTYRT